MQARAGQSSDPAIRVIFPGVAEHLGAGDHSLLELIGKCGQGSLVHAECPQSVPGEGNGHPAILLLDRSPHRRGRLDLFQYGRQPFASACRVTKGEKLVSP